MGPAIWDWRIRFTEYRSALRLDVTQYMLVSCRCYTLSHEARSLYSGIWLIPTDNVVYSEWYTGGYEVCINLIMPKRVSA